MKRALRTPRRALPRLRPLVAGVIGAYAGRPPAAAGDPRALLLVTGVIAAGAAFAQVLPPDALPQANVAAPVEHGAATYTTSGNVGTINQTAPTTIMRWNSFDIGQSATVNIVQPSSTSVLLNKIDGGAIANRTTIDGMLNANGRVYLYNPNGIVFGKTGQVNVDTLMASTLKFDESRVIAGLLTPGAQPLLAADPALGMSPGMIIVDGVGTNFAKLTARTGGQVILAAPEVVNRGQISAPDGQVIIAAGQKVYLAAPASSDGKLRGLVVEVSNDVAGSATPATSVATNDSSGRIDVGRGNATMVGYAVNQKGVVSATTSVNLNGSIYLFAKDQAQRPDANRPYEATRAGQLVIGEGSLTQVLPDANDKSTITAENVFNRSAVSMEGASIEVQSGATVRAPGGDISLKSVRLANNEVPAGRQNPTAVDPLLDPYRVDIADGAVIDASGMSGTQLAMESNVITVDLRGTELADNTVLRDSPLYGTKVQIDIRKGTGLADVSGWIRQTPLGLGQLNAAGGTISLSSSGAVIQRSGSWLKVDGGWVDYLSGYINTTRMKLNDTLVDIGNAQSGVPYTGAVNVPNGPANFEQGYRQGASAGTVKLSSPVIVMQGELTGKAVAGPYQRDVSAAGTPQGGQLQIGNVTRADGGSDTIDLVTGRAKVGAGQLFGYQGKVLIGAGVSVAGEAPAVGDAFDISDEGQEALAGKLALDTDVLGRQGFSRIAALTSGNISVEGPVTLAEGGKLWLGAGLSTEPDAHGVVKPGGDVSLGAGIFIPGGSLAATAAGRLNVAEGVKLDLAGRWTNDRSITRPAMDSAGRPVSTIVNHGGRVTLAGVDVQIGKDATIDVSGGATLSAAGKFSYGKGGSIAITASAADIDGAPEDARLSLGDNVRFAGYGVEQGGSLRLLGRDVTLGGAAASAYDLGLGSGFFDTGGFTSFDIGANLNLTVAANATLAPKAMNWVLKYTASTTASGRMSAAADMQLLPLAGPAQVRMATSLVLRAPQARQDNAGRVLVDAGGKILLDPQATLSLIAGRQLTVDGVLSAPGGTINLDLWAGGNPYRNDFSVWLTANARVDVSGSAQRLYTSPDGISTGSLLDGGTIRIASTSAQGQQTQVTGVVVAQKGAILSANGASARSLVFKSQGRVTAAQTVAGSGGLIDIRAREGLLFDGMLEARSGGGTAAGGMLHIELDSTGNPQSGYPDYCGVLTPDCRVLNITPDIASSGSVPKNLAPNRALTETLSGTGALKEQSADFFAGSGTNVTKAKPAGSGWIAPSAFDGGGFGRLSFRSENTLRFGLAAKDIRLTARDGIVLDAPTIAATTKDGTARTLTVTAPHVQLGNMAGGATPVASTDGSASLSVEADTLDIIGQIALKGFGQSTLAATDDVRLTGVATTDEAGLSTGRMQGSLTATGDLTIKAAQVYPTTLSDFGLFLQAGQAGQVQRGGDAGGTLSFLPGQRAPTQAWSAAGSLTAYAPRIVQQGRIVAPHGSITLGNRDAAVSPILTTSVSYGAGSITSVAGSGLLPLGTVVNGSVPTASDWQYQLSDGIPVSFRLDPVSGQAMPQRGLPAKSITTRAESVVMAANALIDVSGGGSLFAYEFTPGKGGSADILANPAGTRNPVYAVHPAYSKSVAPVDADYGIDAPLAPGRAVYLSGIAGLPAGVYTLLPAHYALMPGGYAVRQAAGTRDLPATANVVLPDGTALVSGRLISGASGGGDTRSSGFLVMSQAVVRKKSEYTISDLSSYFTAKAQVGGTTPAALPTDGGALAFGVSGNAAALTLDGVLRLGAGVEAATTGRRGSLAVSAPGITIADSERGNAVGNVVLSSAKLSALGADSLLIGALRSQAGAGSVLTVGADNVTLANTAAAPLDAADVTLAARSALTLSANSDLRASTAAGRAPATWTVDQGSAIVRVTGSGTASLVRSGHAVPAASLSIANGSALSARSSTLLDTTTTANNGMQVGTFSTFAPGTSLWLGAGSIELDATATQPSSAALLLRAQMLAAFDRLSDLSLFSRSAAVTVKGDVSIGGADTRKIAIHAPGVAAAGNASLSLTASTLQLGSPAGGDGSLPPAGQGSGRFIASATTIELGQGRMDLTGFGQYRINAGGEIIATGSNGGLFADGDLWVTAGRFGTTHTGGGAIGASTHLTLASAAQPASITRAAGFGGSWTFAAGGNLTAATEIVAPSGNVGLTAAGRLALTGGRIDVSGATVSFAGGAQSAPAGKLTLSGTSVDMGAGARIDLSSAAADAGSLVVRAVAADGSGRFTLGGQIAGTGGAGQGQGRFSLDTDSVGDANRFAGLNQALNAAGFTGARQVRARRGDIEHRAGASIVSQEVTLAADDGDLLVAGRIDASGDKGGSISLFASQVDVSGNKGRVRIAAGANLLATGMAEASGDAGTAGNGGTVVLAASNRDGSLPASSGGGASIVLEGGTINVAGSSAARNGSVVLRAPRVAGGNDIAIHGTGTTVSGSASTRLEGVATYEALTISELADSATNRNASSSGAMYTQAAGFAAQRNAIVNRVGGTLGSNVSVAPGIEVRSSSGDLTISVNELAESAADRGWDLSGWRFNGAAPVLTLRAANDLKVRGSISDGFVKPDPAELQVAMPGWALGSGESASYRLAGGADFLAANPLAVRQNSGDVSFGFANRTPSSSAPLSSIDMPVAVVRTGTGRIDVAAGRDITLEMAPFFKNVSDDPSVHDTPAVYDALVFGKYTVSLTGATVYTAGSATDVTDAPMNNRNTQYGVERDARGNLKREATPASFGSGGGAISFAAGRDVNGPHNLSTNWTYRDGDGEPRVEADPEDPSVEPTPGTPGTLVQLPRALPSLVNSWLYRQGRSQPDANGTPVFETLSDGTTLGTAWWARTDYFNQGVATFGGGDITIKAGGNVTDLSVSAATNARTDAGQLLEQGGGDVRLNAGNNIAGGAVYVQKGMATLRAGGSVAAGNALGSVDDPSTKLNPIVALGDARVSITATRDAAIETVYNPTLAAQSTNNVNPATRVSGLSFYPIFGQKSGIYWDLNNQSDTAQRYRAGFAQFSNFSTYSAGSAFSAMSIGGSVLLSNDRSRIVGAAAADILTSPVSAGKLPVEFDPFYTFAPGTMGAVSLAGDVSSRNGFVMMPTASGQLSLLAARSLVLNNGFGGALRMLDSDPTIFSNAAAPRVLAPSDLAVIGGTGTGVAAHTLGGLHASDTLPARLVAKTGDITGDALAPTTIDLPKAAQIEAGRDIVDLGLRIQHNRASDVSLLWAGRDVINTTQANGLSSDPSTVSSVVTGGGRVDIIAARNIDFGNGLGIVTRGNLDNPYLTEGGASIYAVAGARADFGNFVEFAHNWALYGDIAASTTSVELAEFARLLGDLLGESVSTDKAAAATLNFLKKPAAERNALLAQRPDAVRAMQQRVQQFLLAHPTVAQRIAAQRASLARMLANDDKSALNGVFFNLLRETSKQAGLAAFDAAIASLFPNAGASAGGDIAAFASQIKTEQGGSVHLFAPAGSIYAGLTLGLSSRKAYQQGIFTIRGGDISALAKNDFLVNKGRVFTLGGGDITLVSQSGNIDAGRGAKTASSAPPPAIIVDRNGNVTVDVSSSISGSGIATLKTRAGQPDSNVYPIAPRGIFDAGDAGVRSSGKVEITAAVVLNANNISAAGSVSGAPAPIAAAPAPVAAPAPPPAKQEDPAKAQSEQLGKSKEPAPLKVELLGYGDTDEDDDGASPNGGQASSKDKKKKRN